MRRDPTRCLVHTARERGLQAPWLSRSIMIYCIRLYACRFLVVRLDWPQEQVTASLDNEGSGEIFSVISFGAIAYLSGNASLRKLSSVSDGTVMDVFWP